jgi:ferritin-like metal-binding protein YciE
MSNNETQETITSYVTDVLALETHLEQALKGQIADLKGETSLVTELRQVHRTVEQHIAALETLSVEREATGQGIAKVVKKAATSVLGAGAAAIDFVRSEKLPKNLRDDYTALSLASISYVMLHTTALSLGDQEVADLALAHLQDHARHVMTLHNVIPAVVVNFLIDEGLPADRSRLDEVQQNLEGIWRDDAGVPSVASQHRP